MSLVTDPVLAPYMEWSAQKLSKWDGKEWVRFIDEPWTADLYWEQQVFAHMLNIWDITEAYLGKASEGNRPAILFTLCG